MNLPRLMILGLLAHVGPRHGHEIRRVAEQTMVAGWGGVSFGSLYRELRLLEQAGLVGPLRTEQEGNRPVRTVYQITPAGRAELHVLWRRAVREPSLHGPDVFAVALLFGQILDRAELVELLRARRGELVEILAYLVAKRKSGLAEGALGPIDAAIFRRGEARIEAELRWHDEFEKTLAAMPEPSEDKRSSRSSRAARKGGKS